MPKKGTAGGTAAGTRHGIARHGRLRRHPWGTFGKVVASVAVVAVASAMGIGVVAAVNLVSDAPPTVHLVGQTPGPIPDIGALQGGMNLLIAATDSRTGQGGAYGTTDDSSGVGLNDVTMLLHLSQDHSHAEVISFPRDLMIPFPQCPDGQGGWNSAMSQAQLNSSLVDGGLPCTVLVIKQLLDGLDIQGAGLIKFNGVVAMSNAVGGVPVCVGGEGIHDPDTDLDLDPGMHTLSGVTAAQFLRTRHGVNGGSDLARISNQQVFLSSLVRTIMSSGTLSDPVKVWSLAKAARTNITFSDNLNNLTTLYQIALALKGLSFDKITFVQYPVFDDPEDDNRVVPDDESAQTLVDAIKADKPLAVTAGTGSGSVASTASPSAAPSTSPSSSGGGTSGSPTPASTPVDLGDNVYGQNAATQTCSNGAG
ncbi:LCP family protein [Humibacter ginsenosidimutans]|uniref:LytR family transcriptional regulator n=1 Tax=Humibacter ginsenosidimutans TaxID=2599293 RepID=A0A5B8M320_9MICO|nr:LCP family protein [Humibacter ginsenosidimutans]QDZ15198.1 LytR family transcriptional regulator [Humibacter ginsenosidimutans]